MVTIPTPLRGVQQQLSRTLTRALGLTEPVPLRRTDPESLDSPLAPGPVLLIGPDGANAPLDAVATTLLGWGVDVRRWHPDTGAPQQQRWGAVVVDLTNLTEPGEAERRVLALGGLLRELARCARVITLSRAATAEGEAATTAARSAVAGLVRSLGKELRAGATANGIELDPALDLSDPAVLGTLRFLLSARSAFVDGQLIPVSGAGTAPADWTRPLQGLAVVVTGAARGIGAETVRVLARDGAQVLGVDVPAAGSALAAVMNEVGGVALQLDITSPQAGARIHERAVRSFGRLDALVHNAGILRDKLLANMSPEQWSAVVAVNLSAQLAITSVLAERVPGLVQVSLASTSGIAGNRGQTNYGFSKAGVIGATTAWAHRLAPAGGRANAVAPGFIETEMTAAIPAVQREISRRVSSLGQGGRPVDVAEAVAFLLSPQAGGINGAVLRVCGQNLVGR